ncbi:MAG: hypothetical protein BJ554DRAFT_4743, partial [Olpidium bornovanus]
MTFLKESQSFDKSGPRGTTIGSRWVWKVYGLMSGESSVRSSIFEISMLSTTAWMLSTFVPGVAVRPTTRNSLFRRLSSLITSQLAWFPVARWASSTITHDTSAAGHASVRRSLCKTCGVRKNTRFPAQAARRDSGFCAPVSSTESACGMPQTSWQALICWATRGFVGAINNTFDRGNQR